MNKENVVINNTGLGFLGTCFLLFWNFGTSNIDLYDAILRYLMK